MTTILEPHANGAFRAKLTSCVSSLSYSLGDIPNIISPGTYILFNVNVQVSRTLKQERNEYVYELTLYPKRIIKDNLPSSGVLLHVQSPIFRNVETEMYRDAPRQCTDSLTVVSYRCIESVNNLTFEQIWTLVYVFFTFWSSQEYIALDVSKSDATRASIFRLVQSGLARQWNNKTESKHPKYQNHLLLSRTRFWQGDGPLPAGGWIPALQSCKFPSDFTQTILEKQTMGESQNALASANFDMNFNSCPNRRRKLVYTRYVPEYKKLLTFGLLDFKMDSDRKYYGDCLNRSGNTYPSSYAEPFHDLKPFPSHCHLACDYDGTCYGLASVELGQNVTSSSSHAEIRQSVIRSLHIREDADVDPIPRLAFLRSVLHVGWLSCVTNRKFIFLADQHTSTIYVEVLAERFHYISDLGICSGQVNSVRLFRVVLTLDSAGLLP